MNGDDKILASIKFITEQLKDFNRKEQNLVIVGVVGNILKERRDTIQKKKDEAEDIDKDVEELRASIVNVNSNVIQKRD